MGLLDPIVPAKDLIFSHDSTYDSCRANLPYAVVVRIAGGRFLLIVPVGAGFSPLSKSGLFSSFVTDLYHRGWEPSPGEIPSSDSSSGVGFAVPLSEDMLRGECEGLWRRTVDSWVCNSL